MIAKGCKNHTGSGLEEKHVVHVPGRPRYLGVVVKGAPAIGTTGNAEGMLTIWEPCERGEDRAVRELSQAGISAVVGRGREWALVVVDKPTTG
jgi:hypothetical protein